MIFDDLKAIFVTKKDTDDLSEYVPFLINRWLSFSSPALAVIINEACNKLSYTDKRTHFLTVMGVVPKVSRQPHIKYVKKVKPDKEDKAAVEQEKQIESLAKTFELSTREIRLMLNEVQSK